jgi:hypothetical protein
VVDAGPTGQVPNSVTTSVTICVPGTSTCQTIPNVLVDTGSSGLRLLASVVTIPLQRVNSPTTGDFYGECANFATGVTWGPLAAADVLLAGETAHSMSLQVIGDTAAGPSIPSSCSAQGATQDSLALLGANGIIGVGLFQQDCGPYCATTADTIYYDCTAANACSPTTVALASQVSNPVAFFAQDNNGVVLQLPAISDSGAASVNGSLIFGIGTQANNVLTGAVIGVPDSGASMGSFTATYRGVALTNSFFDSGSNGLFFDDSTIATCSATGASPGFYCPGSSAALSEIPVSVSITGSNGSTTVSAVVANSGFLFAEASGSLHAFDDLGAPTGTSLPNAFDFGVPFFFGKSVFTAIEHQSTPGGTGPYFAFQAAP